MASREDFHTTGRLAIGNGNRHQSREGEKPKFFFCTTDGKKWHMKNVNLQRKGQRIFQSSDPEKGVR